MTGGHEKRPSLSKRLEVAAQQLQEAREGKIQLYRRTVEVPEPPPLYSADDIRRIRETLNMSRSEFGSLLAVSARTVESWEHGHRTPRSGHARLLEMFSRPEFVARWKLEAPPPRSPATRRTPAAGPGTGQPAAGQVKPSSSRVASARASKPAPPSSKARAKLDGPKPPTRP